MNLHGMVRGAISTVNPDVTASLERATGYVTGANGKSAPTYAAAQPIAVQVQALTAGDLQHLDGLNVQGVMRSLYVNGDVSAIIRPQSKGGDKVTFPTGLLPEGDVWLVTQVIEQWPDWCKFAITLQNES